MELSREEEYELFQKLYVRYETIPIQTQQGEQSPQKNDQQTIDTIATIKNEIVIPEIQLPEENLDPTVGDLSQKEKIETIVCDMCGGRYSYFNKNRHINTKKHQNSLTLLSFPPEQTVEGSSP